MIKLFTHMSDPDGLGCVILGKLMDEYLDFTLCKGVEELDTYLDFFLKINQAKNYDQVYVTDLCPSDVLLQRIEEDGLLIEQLSRSVQVQQYGDYQVGCVFGPYEIRNDLAEYLKGVSPQLDVLMLFAPDNGSVSFRALKENVEVRSLAESYGGGGHEQAASCSFEATLPYLLKCVLK